MEQDFARSDHEHGEGAGHEEGKTDVSERVEGALEKADGQTLEQLEAQYNKELDRYRNRVGHLTKALEEKDALVTALEKEKNSVLDEVEHSIEERAKGWEEEKKTLAGKVREKNIMIKLIQEGCANATPKLCALIEGEEEDMIEESIQQLKTEQPGLFGTPQRAMSPSGAPNESKKGNSSSAGKLTDIVAKGGGVMDFVDALTTED